ncbi:hypothetical protein VTN02DRAFT_6089 [Thermoascus thermophilus]
MASSHAQNVSNTSSPQVLPEDPFMLDLLVPGYSVISRFLTAYFHVDISFYLSLVFMLAAVAAILRLAAYSFVELIKDYFTSTAEIRLDDEMYNYLMFWVSNQPFANKTNRFVAGTKTNSEMLWEEEDENKETKDDDDDEFLVDFDAYWTKRINQDRLKPLRYTPAEGTHLFRYKGRYLAFERKRDGKNKASWVMNSERLYIMCLGRDPSILKDLLCEAQREFIERDGNKTVIYRGQRYSDDAFSWVRCMAKHQRPLSTVVLDPARKQAFIEDVKEYLHPLTRRWYSNRGIPYRRGYMFHGPPGTGKTSLCFAAAGLLRLKIYLVSLNSKSLTEDRLASLFQNLPRRCIVLLEDVDSAGMTHNRGEEDPEAAKASSGEKDGDGKSKRDEENQGVSLSALLNIIDGVASSEGRILIMTTNHIEKLDPALLRPGRVDMSIEFGNSDTRTIRDLYRSIYTRLEGDLDLPIPPPPYSSVINGAIDADTEQKRAVIKPDPSPGHRHNFSDHQITALAADFAARIPSGEFSPAEIQGYLLKHKTEPEAAVAGAEAWVQTVREEREKRKQAAAAAAAAKSERAAARPEE